MQNCITAAFKIEPFKGSPLDLYISPYCCILEKLNFLMNPFDRICRSLKNPLESFLEEGEWLIAFFGPFVSQVDYEGNPESWDYHCIFFENGIWKHRDGQERKITEAIGIFEYFARYQISPQYFAVKKV